MLRFFMAIPSVQQHEVPDSEEPDFRHVQRHNPNDKKQDPAPAHAQVQSCQYLGGPRKHFIMQEDAGDDDKARPEYHGDTVLAKNR